MHLKNEEVKTSLVYRALREFMVGLSSKEFEDFNTWVMSLMEQNKSLKVKLPTKDIDNMNKIETLYNAYVYRILEPSGVTHNQRRKLLRMVDSVRESIRTVIVDNYDSTEEFQKFSKMQLTLLTEWLMAVFYYNYDTIDDSVIRFQNLAYVLIVITECKQETLEYIVLNNVATGGTLLKTIYTGGIKNDINW